jgi:HPt (histidine-containing phosphotransfer) domain-containing protein
MAYARPVDTAHLSQYTGGDAVLNAEILTLFVGQSDSLLERLDTALAAGDRVGWKSTTHSIKGGARGIGAFPLADAAARAELVDPADANSAAGMLRDLRSHFGSVRLFVEAYLRPGAPT